MMTIGEKIKYLRNQLGITQGKLAEISGIHPVSIRKYETNKMIPQPPQIRKIAEALGVSIFALTDSADSFKLETRGDLMGLLITLCKNNILIIEGKRGEDDMLQAETAAFRINPLIAGFFNIGLYKPTENANEIIYFLKSKHILDDILKWEKVKHEYEKCAAKYSDTQDENIKNTLVEMKDMLELIEMQLQRSNISLNSNGRISVKVSTDYLE